MERANVDTTETITHVGLCAGYGGIELGLKRVLPALRSVALCEIEAFAIANLVAKMEAGLMDAAPIWTDLKTFPWESFRDRVDLLTGGYPCQPFSAAGKRAGKDDPRHLWPWIADGIAAMRPRVCFFENVEGHISLGLSSVISDLEEMGYKVSWGIFSAFECGAPHQRKRVFILAVAGGIGGTTRFSGQITGHEGQSGITYYCGAQAWPSRPGQPQHAWEPPRTIAKLAEPKSIRCSGFAPECGSVSNGGISEMDQSNKEHASKLIGCGAINEPPGVVGNADPRRLAFSINAGGSTEADRGGQGDVEQAGCLAMGNAQMFNGTGQAAGQWKTQARGTGAAQHERQTQPSLGGDADGSSDRLDDAKLYVTCDNRTDELRLLGNGIVPATAALAFTTLLNEQRNTRHLA